MADKIFLRCLGNVPGPRFLCGLTQGDHSVVLAEKLGDFGTVWSRHISKSGMSWRLECLGPPPPGVDPGKLFLFGSNSAAVIITPRKPGFDRTQSWHVEEVPGGVTLENRALRDAGIERRFLDGRTDAADVVLSPNTDPPFTGTHWEIHLADLKDDQGLTPVPEE